MRSLLALVVVAGLVTAGCSGDSGDSGDSDETTDAGRAASEPTPSGTATSDADAQPGFSVTVERSLNIGLVASVVVEAEEPVRAQVTATSGDHIVETPSTAVARTTSEVAVVGMRPDRTYTLHVEVFDDANEPVAKFDEDFTTEPLPPWIVDRDITIDPERSSPGYTVVEFDPQVPDEDPVRNQYLAAYDDGGEVVWYYTNFGTLGGVEQS